MCKSLPSTILNIETGEESAQTGSTHTRENVKT